MGNTSIKEKVSHYIFDDFLLMLVKYLSQCLIYSVLSINVDY